jgi:hypothetical protein
MKYLIIILSLIFVIPAYADLSTFVVPWTASGPDMLPLWGDGDHLTYPCGKELKEFCGGWGVMSYAPDESVILMVDTSKAMMDKLKTNPKYIWIEDVNTEEVVKPKGLKDGVEMAALATDMTVALTEKEKTDIKASLATARPSLKPAEVSALKLEKREDLKDEMLKIHKITKPIYDSSGLAR